MLLKNFQLNYFSKTNGEIMFYYNNGGFRLGTKHLSLKSGFYFQIDLLNRVDDLDTLIGKRKEGLEQSSRSATFERDISQVLKLVGTVILKLVSVQDHLEIVKMADRFWKSMPAALKRPTLDELYRRLRDLDYTQVDERMAVMLNAILQLEEQGEGTRNKMNHRDEICILRRLKKIKDSSGLAKSLSQIQMMDSRAVQISQKDKQ